jgi:hypothetical protein
MICFFCCQFISSGFDLLSLSRILRSKQVSSYLTLYRGVYSLSLGDRLDLPCRSRRIVAPVGAASILKGPHLGLYILAFSELELVIARLMRARIVLCDT